MEVPIRWPGLIAHCHWCLFVFLYMYICVYADMFVYTWNSMHKVLNLLILFMDRDDFYVFQVHMQVHIHNSVYP